MVTELMMTALFGAGVLMFVFWLGHLFLKNAGIVDLGWAWGVAGVSWFYALNTSGFFLRKLLIVLMVTFWAARLGGLLYFRLRKEPHEDSRYQELRKKWRQGTALKFFLLFEFEAVLTVLLTVPVLVVCLNPQAAWGPEEWLGTLIWTFGFVGEAVADFQLKDFKKDPAHKGQICQDGWWYYSRHPNYFFEWLMWVGYFVFALSSPQGWLALVAPALMLFLLLKVTGVPFAEEQALRSRGESYRAYQRSTSCFIPLPKRRSV